MIHPFYFTARRKARLRSFPGRLEFTATRERVLRDGCEGVYLVPGSRLLYCKATVDKLFISANSLLRDSMELARLVVSSGFRPTFLVAMWRGGAPIGIAVQEVLQYHSIIADHIAIRTSSYTGIDQADKTVRVHAIDYLVSRLSADDELLLVDDVFDSGRSLEAVIKELKQRCRRNWPEKWRIATVYYKSSRNRSALVPDYYVLDTDKWLVFPHELIGLTPEEILEHKPVGPNFFETP